MTTTRPIQLRRTGFIAILLAVSPIITLTIYGTSAAAGNPAFMYSHTDTIDGVLFTTATDKKKYNSGDSLRIRYRITNRSMGSVLYDFNTSCQLKIEVIGSNGKTVYSLLSAGLPSDQPKGCKTSASQLMLAPSAEKLLGSVALPLTLKNTDTLTVKAQMEGYPLSTVTVKVMYMAFPTPSGPVALEWTAEKKTALEFNSETKMLIIRVNRAQRLTISAFILTGQKINKLSCERFLSPGTHQISFNNPKLADGVVIFKVEGNGFSETKTINLAR
jgi:hypothetical protein